MANFLDATHLFLALIIFFSSFVNTVAGFGNALIAMPFLIGLFGLQMASPLQSLIGIATFVLILGNYWRAMNFGSVWRIILASILTVPIGVRLLSLAPERVMLPILGGVIVFYVVYRYFELPMPALSNPNFAFIFGAMGGLLSGAYNTAGPPVVVYGDARRWQPDEFRSNLVTVFLANAIAVTISHAVSGNITKLIWQNWLFSLPFLGLGIGLGVLLNPYINVNRFRQFVLLLLFVIGVRLMWSALG